MDLISKLLTVDPKARLTIDQALQHPWMQSKDAELVAHNLDANKDQLKKYLARRRFKKAILAHVAVGRFKKGITADSTRGYSDSTDGVDETSPTEPEEY
jgi:serine/threonine protein kinase